MLSTFHSTYTLWLITVNICFIVFLCSEEAYGLVARGKACKGALVLRTFNGKCFSSFRLPYISDPKLLAFAELGSNWLQMEKKPTLGYSNLKNTTMNRIITYINKKCK